MRGRIGFHWEKLTTKMKNNETCHFEFKSFSDFSPQV